MGVDYYSDLIVGVKYNEIVKTAYETIEEKKFNPDTGEPYIRKTQKKYETFLNKIIDDSKFEESPIYQVEAMGLYIVDIGYEEQYIGLSLSYLDCEGETNIIDIEKIKNTYEKVKNILNKNGYTKNPQIVHLLYAS